MENRYFAMPKKRQKFFQIKLGVLSLVFLMVIAFILFLINVRLFPILFLIIGMFGTMIAPFFDVPSMVEKGKLKYYSCFLLAERENKGIIKIHGGTLFDYYFVLERDSNKKDNTKLILSEYLKGLLKLINDENSKTTIEGTSYIINENTANKIGLKKTQTDGLQKTILLFNYFNLMAATYLAKNKVEFPNIKNVRTYKGIIQDIKAKEQFINQLIAKLEKNDAVNPS